MPPRSSSSWADEHHKQQGRHEATRAAEQGQPLEQSPCPVLACDPGLVTGSLGAVPSIDWGCEHIAQGTLRALKKKCEGGGLGPMPPPGLPHSLCAHLMHRVGWGEPSTPRKRCPARQGYECFTCPYGPLGQSGMTVAFLSGTNRQ